MSTKASCPWITFDLIENLIQRSKADDELKLKSFIVQSGIGKAENFCSNIFRVSATFSYGTQTEQTQSFIVKSSLNVDEFDTINDEVAYFPREIRIYNEILPKVEELLSRIDNVRIAPRCYATGEKMNYLIFEDLVYQDFNTIDKRIGLDYNHMALTLSSLAKWHAATAHLYLTNKPVFTHLLKPYYSPENLAEETIFTNMAKTIALLSRSWTGFEKISSKLGAISHETFKSQYSFYVPCENEFNVLCHGDMWINNLLYRYDDHGNLNDIRIIDFALSLFTSPAYDLFILMYGSSHSDLRPAAWDKLLRHYHTELNHILIQLKYPRRIPTFSDIDSAMANCGIHSVLLVLYIIGLRNMKAVHEDIFRKFLDNSTENESYRVEFFSNPKCFAELKFMLKFFDDKGLLDQFGKY